MAPAVILAQPQLGENIGTAARAMANFGLDDLRLVAPRDGWPNAKAHSAAAAAGAPIVENAQLYETSEAALGDLHFVAATTARPRDMVKPVMSAQTAMAEVFERQARGERCGLLFGAERSGLDNDQIALCDVLVTVPVEPHAASLNLAQAVLIMGYEWIKLGDPSLGRETAFDGPMREGLQFNGTRPAERSELVGFFEQLEAALDKAGFLYPVEKRPAMVRNIRNMFQRMGASEQDVRTLRGIVTALVSDRC